MRWQWVILVAWWSGWADAGPVISEFMASNETTLADEDGDFPDWIEIFNPDAEPVGLGGFFLTDDAGRLDRWRFPDVTLEPGEWLVVFASNKNRDVGELHTNFRLAAAGEYLALVAQDGVTVVSDFGDRYPPQFEDQSFGAGGFGVGYLDEATPGSANGTGRIPGPLFLEFRTGGPRPEAGEDLEVFARVEGASDLTLFYRVGFGAESAVAMTTTDGALFSATVPGASFGELIRWRFVAQDAEGRITKEPPFPDPEDSHEYYGVPVLDPLVESNARVMEWFITPLDFSRLNNALFPQRVRAGVFFEGEYYDNVRFAVRGQSTRFFDKKGFSLNFNRTQRFLWKEGEARVREVDLMTNWGDKAKIRNEMAYEILRESGVPTHFAETIRLQQNGQFFSLTDMVEDADEIYLERAGLNPDGVLYKADDTALRSDDIGRPDIVRIMSGEDPGLAQFYGLIEMLNQDDPQRWNDIFEQIDLPRTINTLAGLAVIMQTDMGAKNYYLFHDPEVVDGWSILPWDLDLTFGRNFTSEAGYFDRRLFIEGYTEFLESQNTSVLVEALLRGNERTRAMYFRRLRTLSDQFLASAYIGDRVQQQLNRLSPPSRPLLFRDAYRDALKWGYWQEGNLVPQSWSSTHPDAETMERATDRLVFEWLPERRLELFQNTPNLPEAQVAPVVRIGALDFDPVSDNQDQEFVELFNLSPSAVDLSGWRIAGAVTMELPPGTVIPAGGSLYLSPDKEAFLQRDLSPTGGEQRFVLGPYSGNLAAEGETIELYDQANQLHDSHTYSGRSPGFNGDSREDRDGDGLNALMEWAIGTSDMQFNILPAPASGAWSYQVRSDLNGFETKVEWTTDLENWSDSGLVGLERVSLGNGFDQVTVGLPGGLPKIFVRLRLKRAGL